MFVFICCCTYVSMYVCTYVRTSMYVRTYVRTLMNSLIVHPCTAVRGANVRDNRGPVRDNRAPLYAIIGSPLYAIIGSSQNYCKKHTDLVTITSQSGHHVPRYSRNQIAMCPYSCPFLSSRTSPPPGPDPLAPGQILPAQGHPQAQARCLDVLSLCFPCFSDPVRDNRDPCTR